VKVCPGLMPGKLMPGTPSMWNGRSSPCQWIEVSVSSVLVTLRRTFCPSRRRISGPGTEPLTAIPCPLRPCTVRGPWPTVRSIAAPETSSKPTRIGEPPRMRWTECPCAHAGIAAKAEAVPSPESRWRRESVRWSIPSITHGRGSPLKVSFVHPRLPEAH